MAALRLSIVILLFSGALVQSICYYPNGGVAPHDTPCRSDTDHATCCGEGYACLSNNICMSTGIELQKNGATTYVRGSCTDKNWRSGDCPNFCADPKVANTGGGNGIGKCDGQDGKVFYCIDREEHDCDKNDNVLFFNEAPTVLTTIGVAATTSVAPTSTTAAEVTSSGVSSATGSSVTDSSSPSSESATAPATPPAKSNTVPIAAGVGGGLGGLAIICACVAFFLWRRAKRSKKQTADGTASYPSHTPSTMVSSYHETWKPSAAPQVFEVPARETRQPRPYELPGSAI